MIDNFTDIELEREQWRDIDGYEGVYQVSDLGRVRSLKFGKTRMLKGTKNSDGYLFVDLLRGGKRTRKSISVHRLVAQTFVPNDDESKTVVNHKNEIRTDNRAVNLEWCTTQYNVTYNDIHLRRSNSKLLKVKDLYDPNLSYNENFKVFKENGVECSVRTVLNLRRDLGISKHYSPREPVRYKIRDLFNPDLSIGENLELFRANGIECSRTTLYRLRKELGLVNQKQN